MLYILCVCNSIFLFSTWVCRKFYRNPLEAIEREHSRKHEQATCVPITLIDDAMINLIKTQKNTDAEYLEEMKTFT